MRGKSRCEDCQFFDYDEETDSNYCTQDLDEDEMERFLRAAVRETHRAQRLTGKLDIRELCAEAHLAAVGEDHFTKPLHGVRQTVGADVRLGLPENFVRRSGLYEIVQHLPAALIVRAGVELAV